MIINVSRAKSFRACQRKAFNYHHRGIVGQRSMNLVDGGAFHAGVAAGRASKDWQLGRKVMREEFDEAVKSSTIPEEQLYLIDQHWQLCEAMLKCFEEQYEHETYQVIQPECEFDVPIPDSEHNCIFMHWYRTSDCVEIWGAPSADEILRGVVQPAHTQPDDNCKCWQPHRIVGKTDAIVSWNGNIWLDEYKTSAISGSQFWDQWQIDVQPTVYIWGIWKAIGIRPRGFLLNCINKPSEAQVQNYNSRRKSGADKTQADYIKYSREAFLRTEQDISRIEQWMLQTAIEWESQLTAITRNGSIPFFFNPSSHTCMSYNRKCDYWDLCVNHEQPGDVEAMALRELDYVDEKLIQLVGGGE